jgi:FkbM family methyltransferase
MTNKYYSQCGQDKYLNEIIFKGKKRGTFLDIGANDGVTFSNTFFFEKELEWKGICVEPLKSAFEKLSKVRNSININACASDKDKLDSFLSVTGYGEMLSGLKSKYDARHLQRINETIKEFGGEVNEIEVQCIDINKVLLQNNFANIDFVSVDTEGNELEILKAIDFHRIQIKAITVENNYKSLDFNLFLSSKGFAKIKILDSDEIYVNKKHFSLFKRFFLNK